MARKFFKPWPRRRRDYHKIRREPTAEEKAILDNAERIRAAGHQLNLAQYDLEQGVHICLLAQRAGWPYNPERFQKVLEAAWRIYQVREKAKGL